jgi:hypothetical protein
MPRGPDDTMAGHGGKTEAMEPETDDRGWRVGYIEMLDPSEIRRPEPPEPDTW